MVYDGSVELPGCDWTDQHTAQGFARRDSVVNFNTLIEFGYADVAISRGAYQSQQDYTRVIAVPFHVTSGKVLVEGPEEARGKRSIALRPGHYRLVAAQQVLGEEEETIHLYFEPLTKPSERSTILIADMALSPSTPLIETAKVADTA